MPQLDQHRPVCRRSSGVDRNVLEDEKAWEIRPRNSLIHDAQGASEEVELEAKIPK